MGNQRSPSHAAKIDKQLSYRRGTARRLKSVEILSAAAQLSKNYIWLGFPFHVVWKYCR